MTTFKVTGHNNIVPNMVFTNVGIPTQFNVIMDPSIDKSTHWISVMLTLDGNPKTVLKPCKFGPEGIHKQKPEHTYFYTDDTVEYNWKTPNVEKANPPTIKYRITNTMILKFQCLNSCQGAKFSREVLIFELHDGENNVIAQNKIEIKVINNHTTKEKEAAKASKKSSEGKRKGDHSECSVAGGTDVHLHINKKLKPGLMQILQETFEPAYAIAKTDKEREIIRMCIENAKNKIAADEPVTTTNKVQATQEWRVSPNQGVQESGNKLCEIKLTMFEKMRGPMSELVKGFFDGIMPYADQSSCAMLRKLREENIVSIKEAPSLNFQQDPVIHDSVALSSTPFPDDRSMNCTATASGNDQAGAGDTYIIVSFKKVKRWFKDENEDIVWIAALKKDTSTYIGDIENYSTMTTTGLRNAEALPASEGGIEEMHMEPDG